MAARRSLASAAYPRSATLRIVLFYHSLISDWNHGNAHFLRGVVWELLARGHSVGVYEPADGWSLRRLLQQEVPSVPIVGAMPDPIAGFHAAYPGLSSSPYDLASLDLERVLDGADLVIAHEWNDPALIRRLGEHRNRAGGARIPAAACPPRGYTLLFHDTHHRAVTDARAMAAYDLRHFDGVLAFGRVLRNLYLERGWTQRAWTWHEAADTRLFRPSPSPPHTPQVDGQLVWIGNWGDEERTIELREFLLQPVRSLGLRATVYGVRYPPEALAALREAGASYGGWLPNYLVPRVFARHRVTMHVPRRPYATALPGIPTIRVFEALACGIPLVSAPWEDVEGLFTPGSDFLVAGNGARMREHLRLVLQEPDAAAALVQRGLRTIRTRHTCGHRVDELMAIRASLTQAV